MAPQRFPLRSARFDRIIVDTANRGFAAGFTQAGMLNIKAGMINSPAIRQKTIFDLLNVIY